MHSMTDSRLMSLVARGDTSAFEELYRRHGRVALAQARRLGVRREQAEEIVQEVFVTVWRSAAGYNAQRGAFTTWLSAIVRNRVTDFWRRRAARPAEVPVDEHESAMPVAAEEPVALADRLALAQQVGELPAEQRDVVFLSFFGGMTHAQIAARSGAPLGTVKGRLRLGLEKLRLAELAAA